MHNFDSVDTLIEAVNRNNDEKRGLGKQGMTMVSLRFTSTQDEIAKLSRFISTDNTLTVLDINGNGIGDVGVQALGAALARNTCLTVLNIKNNGIGDAGAQALGEALIRNSSLTRLDISHNRVGDPGATGLAKGLARNNSITNLNINNNNIGTAGAEALGEVLTQNTCLAELKISYNSIRDAGVKALGKGLARNTGLTWLYASHIDISVMGIKALGEGLAQNTCLINLYIGGVPGDYENIEALRRFINRNRHIPDAVYDYAKAILVPKLVQAIVADEGLSEEDKRNFDLDKLRDILIRETRALLFQGLTAQQIIEFSEHWHGPQEQAKLLKLKDYGDVAWASLIGNRSIGVPVNITGEAGWTLAARTTHLQLKQEGQKLAHCVGGYAGRSITGNSHIISVVNPRGEPVSTIEFITNYVEKTLHVEQHYGRNNSTPSQQAMKIQEWFLQQVQESKIKIDYAGLARSRGERLTKVESFEHKISLAIGFDPLDRDKCRVVKDAYRKSAKLPLKKGKKGQDNVKPGFQSLIQVTEIDLGRRKIGDKSVIKFLQAEKKKKPNLSDKEIVDELQFHFNEILQDDTNTVSLEKNKTKRGKWHDVVIKPAGGKDINRLERQLNDVINRGFISEEQRKRIILEREDKFMRFRGIKPNALVAVLRNYVATGRKVIEEKEQGTELFLPAPAIKDGALTFVESPDVNVADIYHVIEKDDQCVVQVFVVEQEGRPILHPQAVDIDSVKSKQIIHGLLNSLKTEGTLFPSKIRAAERKYLESLKATDNGTEFHLLTPNIIAAHISAGAEGEVCEYHVPLGRLAWNRTVIASMHPVPGNEGISVPVSGCFVKDVLPHWREGKVTRAERMAVVDYYTDEARTAIKNETWRPFDLRRLKIRPMRTSHPFNGVSTGINLLRRVLTRGRR